MNNLNIADHSIIYLAGPITGIPDCRERFAAAERILRAAAGDRHLIIYNPAKLPAGHTNAWYMQRCTRMLCRADALCTLPGWQISNGAGIEIALARYCSKPVLHLSSLMHTTQSQSFMEVA